MQNHVNFDDFQGVFGQIRPQLKTNTGVKPLKMYSKRIYIYCRTKTHNTLNNTLKKHNKIYDQNGPFT